LVFFRLQDKIRIDPINYEDLFLKEIISYKAGIVALATDQIGIIESNLNPNEIEEAFEIFGQGIIYDERRGKTHQMDGRFPRDLVGYRRWHGFLGAASLVQEDRNEFWLNMDRYILLAFLVQSDLKPLASNRNNPYMDEERLNGYKESCNSISFKGIDEAFNYYFPSRF
jgi:hypothetical protein